MQANQELALAIIQAAWLRKDSFDHHAATKVHTAPAESLYRLSLRDACEDNGVNPLLSLPVYLLLANSWDDALEWAQLNKM